MQLTPHTNKRITFLTLALAAIASVAFASTASSSVYGSVAQYSSPVTCKGYTNYSNFTIGVDSPTIYPSAQYSQQHVEWWTVLYRRTGSSMQIANVVNRSATISGPSKFGPVTFRTDSNGTVLKGQFIVRSVVYWFNASGAIIDADDFVFTEDDYLETLNGSAWYVTRECSF
jgi:hypothetical protein